MYTLSYWAICQMLCWAGVQPTVSKRLDKFKMNQTQRLTCVCWKSWLCLNNRKSEWHRSSNRFTLRTDHTEISQNEHGIMVKCWTDSWTLWEKVRVGWSEKTASKHVHYQVWNRSPVQVGCMRQVLGAGVHWDDPEGWDGEGGGRGVQDGEHMWIHGWFMSMYGKNHYSSVK